MRFTPPAGAAAGAWACRFQGVEAASPYFFQPGFVESEVVEHLQTNLFRESAREILACCLDGVAWPDAALQTLLRAAQDPHPAVSAEAGTALFQTVAEGLADRFEPRLTEVYAELFAKVIASVEPRFDSRSLVARYRRVRRVRRFREPPGGVAAVYVLSRVTLGADVAVTSVILDAAKRRFPAAAIWLAGGRKNYELFAADSRVGWAPVAYGRTSSLRDRLTTPRGLEDQLSAPGSLVIDPDSRISQLGLVPISPEENYYLFDSRSYGGDGEESLAVLARRWVDEVFDVRDAVPYVAPLSPGEPPPDGPYLTVNLGVGDNPAKRLPEPFEEEILRHLAGKGWPVFVDLGAGGGEEARVRAAIERCGAGPRLRPWRGSFAAFAALIARSRLYLGYDSAGQHAAAACGVPLVTVFAGFPTPRMLARWTPTGPGPKEIVRVDQPEPQETLRRTIAAISRLSPDPAA
ncbi:MAG: hypothetical protein IT159_00375 [Bryobacterales bacterium]|nr:hypothetical protein [Bryobacterales bacterium]